MQREMGGGGEGGEGEREWEGEGKGSERSMQRDIGAQN